MLNPEQQDWPLRQFFDHYTQKIERKEPFAFVRWGDGEMLFDHFTRTRAIRRSIIEIGQDSATPDFGRQTKDDPVQ